MFTYVQTKLSGSTGHLNLLELILINYTTGIMNIKENVLRTLQIEASCGTWNYDVPFGLNYLSQLTKVCPYHMQSSTSLQILPRCSRNSRFQKLVLSTKNSSQYDTFFKIAFIFRCLKRSYSLSFHGRTMSELSLKNRKEMADDVRLALSKDLIA